MTRPLTIDPHTHMFAGSTVREDIAPAPLVERFGPRWWFDVCVSCGRCRLCPATGIFERLAPEVPVDWVMWKAEPHHFEIEQAARAVG